MKNLKSPVSGLTGEEIFSLIVCTIVVLGSLSLPITSILGTMSQQKVINEQCGTNYNFIDIAFSGDSIKELCKMKQQTLTIK